MIREVVGAYEDFSLVLQSEGRRDPSGMRLDRTNPRRLEYMIGQAPMRSVRAYVVGP